ncbi:MAG: hypothetical protein JJE01_06250 [Gemmatimonadetes bacterium]|nr:hypothetical protein [Gemmatimonadota bacterium]
MRGSRLIALTVMAVICVANTAHAQRFPGSEEKSYSGFALGLTAGYTFLGGEVGDSVSGGLRLQGTAFYDFGKTPVQVGVGGAYSWMGFDYADGALGELSLFAFGTWKVVDLESTMVPYFSLRVGWTRLSDDQPCGSPRCGEPGIEGTRTRSGLDIGAGVGIEYPLSRKLVADLGGGFDWLLIGDYQIDGRWIDTGEPVSDRLPDSSQEGSAFILFAGLKYFISP